MKKISNSLKSHLKGQVTTITNCWRVTLKDGTQLGFTDYNDNITYDGIDYHCGKAVSTSSIESCNSLSADNFEIVLALNSFLIHQDDLLGGKYDKAYIEYFILNYADHTQGHLLIKAGFIHDLRLSNNKLTIEVRGAGHDLNKQTCAIYSDTCRARFKDARCKAKDIDYILSGQISNMLNAYTLEIDSSIRFPSIYSNTKMEFFDDSNSKYSCLVKDVIGDKIILQKNTNVLLKKGYKFLLFPQCDKKFFTCSNIFYNALNFRGEPHVPGVDEINKTAGTFK